MAGYIKLYRDIQKHWIWEDKPYSRGQAWTDLLFMANYKPSKFPCGDEIIEVDRGSLVTSELKLMERWGWSKTKLRAFLKLLQNDSMILKKTDRKKTIITIVNYSVYQDSETTEEPIKDQKRTDERPKKDTSNKVNKVKKEKNIYGIYSNVLLSDDEFQRLVSEFGQENTSKAIEYLSAYKEEKGYKTKNDNLTLRRWVFDAISKRKPVQEGGPKYADLTGIGLEE